MSHFLFDKRTHFLTEIIMHGQYALRMSKKWHEKAQAEPDGTYLSKQPGGDAKFAAILGTMTDGCVVVAYNVATVM